MQVLVQGVFPMFGIRQEVLRVPLAFRQFEGILRVRPSNEGG
jgi:hypothetical protein